MRLNKRVPGRARVDINVVSAWVSIIQQKTDIREASNQRKIDTLYVIEISMPTSEANGWSWLLFEAASPPKAVITCSWPASGWRGLDKHALADPGASTFLIRTQA